MPNEAAISTSVRQSIATAGSRLRTIKASASQSPHPAGVLRPKAATSMFGRQAMSQHVKRSCKCAGIDSIALADSSVFAAGQLLGETLPQSQQRASRLTAVNVFHA